MQFALHYNFMQGLIFNTILLDLNLAAFSIYYDFQKRHTNAYMEVEARKDLLEHVFLIKKPVLYV